jgi:PilZ domain
MPERRTSRRISVFLEIREIDGKPLDNAQLLDFSESGAKIETPFQHAPGELLKFSFALPDRITEVSRQGKVIWALPHDTKPGYYLVGLEFPDAWELGKRQT